MRLVVYSTRALDLFNGICLQINSSYGNTEKSVQLLTDEKAEIETELQGCYLIILLILLLLDYCYEMIEYT